MESEQRPELDRRSIFYLACREIYIDGRVGEEENRFLNDLRTRLEIPVPEAVTIARVVEREWRAGLLRQGAELEREKVFRSACGLAWVDGLLQKEEQELLRHLSAALRLGEEQAREILREVHAETSGDEPPAGHPVPLHGFEFRLRAEITDWVEEGILTANQGRELRERYSVENVVTYEDLRRKGPTSAASAPAIVFIDA